MLLVADAVAIGAFYDAAQRSGQANVMLSRDLEIFDDVDRGLGGNYGNFLQSFFIQHLILDLDDVFMGQCAGGDVHGHHHRMGDGGADAQDAQHGQGHARPDMIYHRALSDTRDFQLLAHASSPFRSSCRSAIRTGMPP